MAASTSVPRREISNGQNDNEKRYKTAGELIGYLEMPLIMLAALQEAKHPGEVSPYALDVYVIEAQKPVAASLVVDISNEYPVLGAILDKFALGGPVVGLFLLSLSIGGQCMENHGKLPDKVRGMVPGLLRREDLASTVQAKAEAAMAE